MTRRILAQVGKDFRRVWPLALAWLALLAIQLIPSLFVRGLISVDPTSGVIEFLVGTVGVLVIRLQAVLLLVATTILIQDDPPLSMTSGWRLRPLSGLEMALAKACAISLFFILPAAIVATQAISGFGALEGLAGQAIRETLIGMGALAAAAALVVSFFGSSTRQALLFFLPGLALMALLGWAYEPKAGNQGSGLLGVELLDLSRHHRWLPLLTILITAPLLLDLYRRRRRLQSLTLLVTLSLGAALWPYWNSLFAPRGAEAWADSRQVDIQIPPGFGRSTAPAAQSMGYPFRDWDHSVLLYDSPVAADTARVILRADAWLRDSKGYRRRIQRPWQLRHENLCGARRSALGLSPRGSRCESGGALRLSLQGDTPLLTPAEAADLGRIEVEVRVAEVAYHEIFRLPLRSGAEFQLRTGRAFLGEVKHWRQKRQPGLMTREVWSGPSDRRLQGLDTFAFLRARTGDAWFEYGSRQRFLFPTVLGGPQLSLESATILLPHEIYPGPASEPWPDGVELVRLEPEILGTEVLRFHASYEELAWRWQEIRAQEEALVSSLAEGGPSQGGLPSP